MVQIIFLRTTCLSGHLWKHMHIYGSTKRRLCILCYWAMINLCRDILNCLLLDEMFSLGSAVLFKLPSGHDQECQARTKDVPLVS